MSKEHTVVHQEDDAPQHSMLEVVLNDAAITSIVLATIALIVLAARR